MNIKRRVIIGASEPWNPAWQSNIFPHADEIHSVVLYGPNSGQWHDLTQVAAYAALIAEIHGRGCLAFAYVSSSYGDRPLADVKTDIDKWRTLFSVDGYFIDECAQSAAMLDHYQTIRGYIPLALGLFLNFGRVPDERYTELRASLCISERSAADVLTETYPAWVARQSSDKLLVIASGAKQSDVGPLIKKITDSNVRFYCISAAGQNGEEADYGIETELFAGATAGVGAVPPAPAVPPPTPLSADMAQLVEMNRGLLRKLRMGSEATIKDIPAAVDAMLARMDAMEAGIRGLTDRQVVAELARRFP